MHDPIILTLYNNTIADNLLWQFIGPETFVEPTYKVTVMPSGVIYDGTYIYQPNDSQLANLRKVIRENISRQDARLVAEKRQALLRALDN